MKEDIHREATEKLGKDGYDRLILSERAYNQTHWMNKIYRALEYKGTPKEKLLKLTDTLVQMEEQTKEYWEQLDGKPPRRYFS